MSVRVRPPGQVAPGHAVPAPAKHLPLKTVLATGIMNKDQKSELDTPEGAKCFGQIRFVGKQGLSNKTLSFEFYVRRAKRQSFLSDPMSIFWEETPSWWDEPYEVTPDSFNKVVDLFVNLRKRYKDAYFMYRSNSEDENDDGTLLFDPLTRELKKDDLRTFLAENGKVIGLQNCIVYVTPVKSMRYAEENWS